MQVFHLGSCESNYTVGKASKGTRFSSVTMFLSITLDIVELAAPLFEEICLYDLTPSEVYTVLEPSGVLSNSKLLELYRYHSLQLTNTLPDELEPEITAAQRPRR